MTVFWFIEAQKAIFPLSLCCRLLGVSRSGFHAWQGTLYLASVLDCFSRRVVGWAALET